MPVWKVVMVLISRSPSASAWATRPGAGERKRSTGSSTPPGRRWSDSSASGRHAQPGRAPAYSSGRAAGSCARSTRSCS